MFIHHMSELRLSTITLGWRWWATNTGDEGLGSFGGLLEDMEDKVALFLGAIVVGGEKNFDPKC